MKITCILIISTILLTGRITAENNSEKGTLLDTEDLEIMEILKESGLTKEEIAELNEEIDKE